MKSVPQPSPRDESTDHIPDTGSDTPRDSNAGLGLGLAALKAKSPWITKVVVVRLMDERNADWQDMERIPAFAAYFEACRSGIEGLLLELVLTDDWSGNSALVAFPDERHAGDDYCLWQFERSTDWGAHGFEFLRLELVDDDGADTLSAKLGQAHDEWWAGYTPSEAADVGAQVNDLTDKNAALTDELRETNYWLEEWADNLNKERRLTAILRAELKQAHDELNTSAEYVTELRGVIQRQGGRVDREHAGLVAQVTRLTTELDNANLHNDELRAIVAGRSNQVEDELDEALRVGANYRSKVAALFTELGEAIDLLEAVSAEADSYADRLKARGAA